MVVVRLEKSVFRHPHLSYIFSLLISATAQGFGAPLDVGYKGVAKASMQPSGTFCASRGDPLTGIMLV